MTQFPLVCGVGINNTLSPRLRDDDGDIRSGHLALYYGVFDSQLTSIVAGPFIE